MGLLVTNPAHSTTWREGFFLSNRPPGLAQQLEQHGSTCCRHLTTLHTTGSPCFLVPHRCRIFYELKARPSSSKNISTHFIAILALLQWSGARPAASPRRAWSQGSDTQTASGHTPDAVAGGGAAHLRQRDHSSPQRVRTVSYQGQLSVQREKIKALSSFNLILLLHQWS